MMDRISGSQMPNPTPGVANPAAADGGPALRKHGICVSTPAAAW